MRNLFGKRHKQSGQASLEMILMVGIGVLIALGLIYRFNTAFKKYTVDMYGSYYRCLLETGELPGVPSVCKDKDARFAIANGKTLVTDSTAGGTGGTGPGGGSGGGGSGSSGNKGSDGSSGSSEKKGSSGKSTAGSSSDSSDGGGGSSNASPESVGPNQSSGGGRGSTIARLRGMQKSKSTAVGSASGSDKESNDNAPPPPVSVGKSNQANDLRGARTKMNFEMEGAQYTRAESASVTPTTARASSSVKKGEASDSLRPRKAVEKGERAVAGKLDENKGGGLEFGKLFRLFLIIAIIVAIAIFLGGQVLQISKSGDR